MTIDGGEPGLEVPVTAVGPPRRDRRRAAIVAVAVVGIVGGAIALSRLDDGAEAIAVVPTPGRAPSAPATSRGPTAPPSPPQSLADVDNVPLLDGPTPALVVRSGSDAELLAWTPGEPALELVRTFPNAYDPASENQYVMLSPDGRSLASLTVQVSATVGNDRIRLVYENGIQWEHTGISADTGVAWSSGSDRLAVVGGPTSWVLAEIAADGTVTEREIDLGGSASPGPVESRQVAPVGFSADSRTVVAGFFNDFRSTVEPAYALDFESGAVAPLERFPVRGPTGLTASGQEFGFVDPIRGRTYTFPISDGQDEPPPLEVLEPNGAVAYTVESGAVIRAMWDDAGRLAILEGDSYDVPSPLNLVRVTPDGFPAILFTSPLVARGALLGIRDGYAGLALQVDDPRRTQLVLVDMEDGLVSGIEVTGLGVDGPHGAGWLP